MGNGLYKLAQEDPSFHYARDEETNQVRIRFVYLKEWVACRRPLLALHPAGAHHP